VIKRTKTGKQYVDFYPGLKEYDSNGVRKENDAEKWWNLIIAGIRAAVYAAGMREPIAGPVKLEVDYYFSRTDELLKLKYPISEIRHDGKPDIDNLQKLLMDAITKSGWREGPDKKQIKTPLVWFDDSQISCCQHKKWYVARGGKSGARIVITRLQDPEPSLLEHAGVAHV